jgi:hypothetical protein
MQAAAVRWRRIGGDMPIVLDVSPFLLSLSFRFISFLVGMQNPTFFFHAIPSPFFLFENK